MEYPRSFTNQVVPVPVQEYEFNPHPYEERQTIIDELVRLAKEAKIQGSSPPKTLFFDDMSEICADIKAGATSWRALHIIYNFEDGDDPVANFWVNMRNAQAVRNRLKMSVELLTWLINNAARKYNKGKVENPVHILSLAAGSAQGVLEAVARAEINGICVRVTLIDTDKNASAIVTKNIERFGVRSVVEFISDTASKFTKYVDMQNVDIVEMLGWMDYLNNTFAKRVVQTIGREMSNGTHFITCHIHDNPERGFLTHVIDWGEKPYMHYRSVAELEEILLFGNFAATQVLTEPHGIHSIAVCRK